MEPIPGNREKVGRVPMNYPSSMPIAETTLWPLSNQLNIQPEEKLDGQMPHPIAQHSELRLCENIIHQIAGLDEEEV
jgi:hypothetical protein